MVPSKESPVIYMIGPAQGKRVVYEIGEEERYSYLQVGAVCGCCAAAVIAL
jgi:hypothetical protein